MLTGDEAHKQHLKASPTMASVRAKESLCQQVNSDLDVQHVFSQSVKAHKQKAKLGSWVVSAPVSLTLSHFTSSTAR